MAKPTIHDVAKLCGVSATTVSLTLRGKGRISEHTRERIFCAIEELGYVYNQSAANLSSKKSNLVGLVLHDITNPIYNQLTAGISHKLDSDGYLLFLANCESDADKQQRFIESLMSQNTSGLVVCPAKRLDTDYLHALKRRNVPVVFAVRSPDLDEYDFVGIDNFKGAQIATDYLLGLGHRKIGFVGNLIGSKTASHRVSGYMGRLMEQGIEPDYQLVRSCENNSRQQGYLETLHLLNERPDVTALVCYTDTIAYGAMRALAERGLRVGEDIAVIGFDDLPESAETVPPLTTVSACAKELGRTAAEALLLRINGSEEPAKQIILSPRLTIRQSCGEQIHQSQKSNAMA
ncbi:LacI family DNA-binding transcriptional regulator [Photobacterium rosenbergii]|uniref:LacI family DNA-binding transcriptional regulator n=1 Tax=Photobacterium rosenbergii TaxID=294936 RepID=UPI001C9904E0|nr:LacI family DNA-binding transcriptional regulator [Photobacterium rosenbergii]MBY5946696.1 LacI family DNA-binding transcriptional regulator [Photobacterium rosenbergii]